MFKLTSLLLLLILYGSSTPAQQSRDVEKEKAIWAELETLSPASVPDFKAATEAMDAQDFDKAIALYRKVHEKAPDFDAVLRRLGGCLVATGETDSGFALMEQALAIRRSPENLISLAQSLAYPGVGHEGTKAQKSRAYELTKETNRLPQPPNDPDYLVLQAQLAIDLNKIDDFRHVTEQLVAKHPQVMATHYYNAILAAFDEKWSTAEQEIKVAQSLGLAPEVAQQFLDSGVQTRARVWQYLYYALYLVGAWIVGLTALFVVGKLMSRKTLNSLEKANPNSPASESELTLRKWYRQLINVAGFYYYISLPVVIFLVIIVAASVTYGFIMLGRIPIKLVAILAIGGLITIYTMVRSLFIKIEDVDPGRSLSYDEAPALWDLTRTVAATVNTRAVDEIRITPGTDLAVYEKGTRKERSQDKAQRVLILGVGVLNDFKQNAFRAVLAHEYGHFTHRDTAGGDVAIRVNNDMMKFAHAMIASDQASWLNIAFHFVRIYHFIFRRISHGATRLQEVLADRVAALKYGPLAFEEGLTHVVRKSVEFHHLAAKEIDASLEGRRALQNLYELRTDQNPDIQEEIEESLNRETSEDDTHPCPKDRFRLTRRIAGANELPATGMVWDLFKNPQALTNEMTSLIQSEVQSAY
ncbi:MAG TPA: tetratricopeptide repeat protein [Pyrinomonadaceae bacterium]|nr:tetratricopeptide repeat protein [Pyrinomonadaceae bacterium]